MTLETLTRITIQNDFNFQVYKNYLSTWVICFGNLSVENRFKNVQNNHISNAYSCLTSECIKRNLNAHNTNLYKPYALFAT